MTTTIDPTATRILETSKRFWEATEARDTAAMRAIAAPECMFVHIGATCDLERELKFYDDGVFQPTGVDFHRQDVTVHGSTAVVISDVDYSLLLNGEDTTHHFAVTEIYVSDDGNQTWRLLQFSFTALVY
ncbi:MAG: nuclear transport factor 2 family protein [Actinomyces succiniciruminis]|nr:nuclear transport factor 2 family protein [Actinomyces succiniciruminis]